MKKKRLIKVFLFLWHFVYLYAGFLTGISPVEKPLELYKQRVYTMEENLPQNSIYNVIQTPEGFIWLTTDSGLVRFDGIQFEIFNRKNTPVLETDRFSCFLVDRDSVLWIGTRGGGLICYKNGNFEKTYTFRDGLCSNEVNAILESSDGTLWIGTSKGLNRLQQGKIVTTAMQSKRVERLAEDSRGRLWVGTPEGLFQVKPAEPGKEYIAALFGFADFEIVGLVIDSRDRIWVGTKENGVFRLQKGKQVAYNTENGLSSNLISNLYLDRDNTLWIATRSGGVNWIPENSDNIFIYDSQKGLSYNYVYSVYKDRQGNLWIATNGGGLNLLIDAQINAYTTRNGLACDQVYGVYSDSRDTIWIGVFGSGVQPIEKGKVLKPIAQQDGLPSNLIPSICEGPRGDMWFGTYGKGVARMNKKTGNIKTYNTRDGLISDFVFALHLDSKNRLWVGTGSGGLHRFANGQFTLVNKTAGKIRTLLEDRQGYLWAGSEFGLFRIKDGIKESFDISQGLSSKDILGIYQDKNGDIWVCTFGGGINRYRDGEFKVLKQSDGLPHDIIFWIMEDDSDFLWMSSMEGIFRVSHQELENFFNGISNTITGKLFTEAEGMKSRECNGGSQPSGCRTRDGRLWFITSVGAAEVDPANIAAHAAPPPVVIKTVTVDNSQYTPRPQLTIPPGKGNIEVQYTGFNFVAPKRVRFKYQLQGYDEAWIEAGSRRSAYYTNIPYGTYHFRIKASIHKNQWNKTGASLKITIQPHFWQTWQFRILVIFFNLFLIGSFVYFIMKGIKSRQQVLEQQVAERTQNLQDKTRELENKSTTLEKINTIVKTINEKVNPKDVLTSILRETARLEGFERARALLYDKSLQAYTFNVALGYDMNQLSYLRLSPREVENRYIKVCTEISDDIFIGKSILILRMRVEDIEKPSAGYLLFEHKKKKGSLETRDIGMLKELKSHIVSAFIKSKLLIELEAERKVAEEANQAKSMFLARMSHEIRTPMNSVIGFAEMLQETGLNQQQADFTLNITKSGEALLHLIEEILDFSKIEAGQMTLQSLDMDLKNNAFDVCRLMQPRLGGKPVEILCQFGEKIPVYVKSDPGRISQVLVNLMGNAAKFTRSGEIKLAIDMEEETEKKLKLHMTVHDTGIGIARDQLDTIFEAFHQEDGSITRKYGGTGLGLAISRQIALLMGGDLWVESEKGKGSTFHFTAWVDKSRRQPTQPPEPHQPSPLTTQQQEQPYKNESIPVTNDMILLVEDHPMNQKLARFMLTRGGYQVEVVNNGKEAVETYTADPGKFRLIFMDINMPEMDGREATRIIRKRGFTKVPIIAMTAHAMKDDREKCLQAGMNDYIAKPIKRNIVFSMIKKWMSNAQNAKGSEHS